MYYGITICRCPKYYLLRTSKCSSISSYQLNLVHAPHKAKDLVERGLGVVEGNLSLFWVQHKNLKRNSTQYPKNMANKWEEPNLHTNFKKK